MSNHEKGQLNPNATGFTPNLPFTPSHPYGMPQQPVPPPNTQRNPHKQQPHHTQQHPNGHMMYPYNMGMPPGLPPNGQFPPGSYPPMQWNAYHEPYFHPAPYGAVGAQPPNGADLHQPGQPNPNQPPFPTQQFPSQPTQFFPPPPFDGQFYQPFPGMGAPMMPSSGGPTPLGPNGAPVQFAPILGHPGISPAQPENKNIQSLDQDQNGGNMTGNGPVHPTPFVPIGHTPVIGHPLSSGQPDIAKGLQVPEQDHGVVDMNVDDYYDDYLDEADDCDDRFDLQDATSASPIYSIECMYDLNPASALVLHHENSPTSIAVQISKLSESDAQNLFQTIYTNTAFVDVLPFLKAHQPQAQTILNKRAVDYSTKNNLQSTLSYESVVEQGSRPFRSRVMKPGSSRSDRYKSSTSSNKKDHDDYDDGYGGDLFDGENITADYYQSQKQQTLPDQDYPSDERPTTVPILKTGKPRLIPSHRSRQGPGSNDTDYYLRLEDQKPEKRRFVASHGLSRGNMGSVDPEEEERKRERAAQAANDDQLEKHSRSERQSKDKDSSQGFSFGLSRDIMGSVDESAPKEQRPSREKNDRSNRGGDDAPYSNRRDFQQRGGDGHHSTPMRARFGPNSSPADWKGQLEQNFQSLFNKLSALKFTEVSHDIAFQVMSYATLSSADKFKQVSEMCAVLLYDHALLNTAFAYLYATLTNVLSENLPPCIQAQPNPQATHAFKSKIHQTIQENFSLVTDTIMGAPSIQSPIANAPLLVYVAEHSDEVKIRAQEKFISWIQFFSELYNQSLLPPSFIKTMLVELRFVTNDEFTALCDLPERDPTDKAKEFNHVVDLKRLSFEALQAWHTLLLHCGQQIEKQHPQVAALMFSRCQWLSDHKPLSTLFRFKLKDILDFRRDGWQNQPINRPKIDLKMTPESIKVYEISDEITSQKDQHEQISQKKQLLSGSKQTAPQATSALAKLDSAGKAVGTTPSSVNIFSRFFKPAAAAPAAAASLTPTPAPAAAPAQPEESKTSKDKWTPNASCLTDSFLNTNLIIDFCHLSSDSWTPIRTALRSCLSDFDASGDIGEINYAFSGIIAKPANIELFAPYVVTPTQPNARNIATPLQLAQSHLPVFFVITFLLHCFKTRSATSAATLNTIIYKYTALLQYDVATNTNTSISLEDITIVCRDMFIVNWQHVIYALFAGLVPNITDISEEYPKASELLPNILAIWTTFCPSPDPDVVTVPTNLAFTVAELFLPLVTVQGGFHASAGSMINDFIATASGSKQSDPKGVAMQLNTKQYSAGNRTTFLSQVQTCATFFSHATQKNQRLIFPSIAEAASVTTDKIDFSKLPIFPYSISQFILQFTLTLYSPEGSSSRAALTPAQFTEYEQILNFKLLFSNFLSLTFTDPSAFLPKLDYALKKSSPSTVPASYQPIYEIILQASGPTQAHKPPRVLWIQVLSKLLPPETTAAAKLAKTKQHIDIILSLSKLFAAESY